MVRELESESSIIKPTHPSTSTIVDRSIRYLVGGLCVSSILLFAISFTVREGSQSIVFRFGEPVRVVDQAGIQFKAPWPIERVIQVDNRRRALSTPETELLTRDKKNIVLKTGGVWRPDDVERFYRALGSIENADEKIIGLIINAKIAVFGRYDLSALVSTDSDQLQVSRIERDVLDAVNTVAIHRYGIEVTHIGFQRISLPEQNIGFVLEQMRAERRQFAARFRAEGELEAARIRSNADLEVANLIAAANEEAARIIGVGEAEAAKTYAAAYDQDPDFYQFVRSLETLKDALGPTSSVTLRTDSEPFNLLIGQDAPRNAIPTMPTTDEAFDTAASQVTRHLDTPAMEDQ